jgi:hypothetical protein
MNLIGTCFSRVVLKSIELNEMGIQMFTIEF